MVDSRVIKPNRMNDDEIRSILLQAGIQGLQKQAGYIAPCNPEMETLVYGDSPMAGWHTYHQFMQVGRTYPMTLTWDKRVWLHEVGLHAPVFSVTDHRYFFRFLLVVQDV